MSDLLPSRPFTWDDVLRLHDLVRRSRHGDPRVGGCHTGDLYWVLRATPPDDPLAGMRAWHTANGSLEAVAWLDPPSSGDTIVSLDADASTFQQALDWLEGEQGSNGRASLSIVAQHGDTVRIDALERRGYAESAAGDVRLRCVLGSAQASVPLPEGFSLRHVSSDEDIERRVSVEASAFGGSVSLDRWGLLAQRLPTYRPSLDLIAVASDGTGASACTCWYDEEHHRGEIEAVGTSKQFQRLGIGKAVITEGLRRLQALGATEAVLYTNIGNVASLALYRSCGFEPVAEDHAWVKQL